MITLQIGERYNLLHIYSTSQVAEVSNRSGLGMANVQTERMLNQMYRTGSSVLRRSFHRKSLHPINLLAECASILINFPWGASQRSRNSLSGQRQQVFKNKS